MKEWLLALILAIPLVAYSIIVNSIVFMYIWGWFVTPYGIDEITYTTSLSICVVVSFLNSGYTGIPDGKSFEYLRHVILNPLLTLLTCKVVHIFLY